MSADDSKAENSDALFPLTVFDRLFERTTFVTGWLMEGELDTDAIAAALDRLTDRWRMLAGRLEAVKEQAATSWRLRIPLGPFPPGYQRYSLTTTDSTLPLSTYITVPLPLISPSLPYHLFVHPSTPRQYVAWEATQHPLTCWHVTRFGSQLSKDGKAYTCIGFSRSHGIFDGVGAAAIMRALIAELKGNGGEHPYPPPLQPGQNANPVQEALDNEPQPGAQDDATAEGYSVLGVIGTLRFIGWHLRERWWRGADREILILPFKALEYLVNEIRKDLEKDQTQQAVRATTGDILVAWLFKTIYSEGTPPEKLVHCSNIASFRSQLSTPSRSLGEYPHNAFVPLSYPIFTVGELSAQSVSATAHCFAVARTALSVEHVTAAQKILQKSITAVPLHAEAHETLVVSNVSASRILESDWSAAGAGRTIAGYRYQLTPTDTVLANAVYIAGRLDDSSIVFDTTLSRQRMALLEKEVRRLIAQAGESS